MEKYRDLRAERTEGNLLARLSDDENNSKDNVSKSTNVTTLVNVNKRRHDGTDEASIRETKRPKVCHAVLSPRCH